MQVRLPTRLSDAELLAATARFAGHERQATARLIAHLGELEARRLHLAAGYASLFTYCCSVLRLSEHGAYKRIAAARSARRFPRLLDLLANGALSLTTLRLLAPHLTQGNHAELLAAASWHGKREVEELIARRFPLPPPPALLRRLSEPRPAPSAQVLALAADRYEIRFTARAATRQKLGRAQDLLRHALPSGDPAEIVDRALTLLLDELARSKHAALKASARTGRTPAPGSRHVPAAVKRAAWLRDGGRCAFVAADGRRCVERSRLEFHHVQPYAVGGEATTDNIQLRCRPHNAHEAERFYGSRDAGILARSRVTREE